MVGILKHVVGGGEALFDFAARVHVGLMPALPVRRKIASRLNLRSARFQRLFLIQDERERFVFDIDQPKGLLGHVPVNRGHRRHRVAREAHRIVEQVPLVASVAAGPLDVAILTC